MKEERQPKDEAAPVDTPTSASVLDSVFSSDGPMPSASVWLRALAFLLDFVLISAVASILIWKIVLPQSHPAAFAELTEWTSAVMAWVSERSSAPDAPMPEPDRGLREALQRANELQLLCFWFYFALGEAFFAGSSLGKRICRIRSVSTVTLGPLPILSGIVRGGLKTLTIFFFFPIGMAATLATLFFNQRRQMGHDLLSRSAVIDEKKAAR
ncbi:MAG: hypothetical protein GVY36_00275 [Verrucomicrobia bacterium]|nr:hypothetical protein [Verrucomicrobiota bacterium]